MPDWAELTSALAKDAGTPPNTPAIVVAQRYEQRFGRVQLVEAIREALHVERARPGKAHRAFVQLPFDTVYTTNFDLLLEDAYSEAIRPFRSLVGELQLPFHAGQIASSIVKMHGDLRHEEHFIVTQRDYDSYMERYPVIATHLSAMLITRTPMFLGYSLSDPDFENIRKIVRSRLGVFERMAYVIQFDVEPKAVEAALDKRLHIISLNTSSGTTRSEVLASFFSDIQTQLDAKSAANIRSSRPDLFEDVETEIVQSAVQTPQHLPLLETTSRLCFVMMPLIGKRSDDVYRMLISPAVTGNGMTTLRADEMAGSGFIIEQIRTAIQQSRLCIADLTGANPNVLYEVGYSQAVGKPLVLLAEEGSQLPFDIAHVRVIFYGSDLEAAQSLLRRAISVVLSSRLQEAIRLLELKEYRGAIAVGGVVLEQRLRESLAQYPPENFARMGLSQMLRVAVRRKIVDPTLAAQLADAVAIRNRAVHDHTELTESDAKLVLDVVSEVLSVLPQQ